jgi:hypothetical protein
MQVQNLIYHRILSNNTLRFRFLVHYAFEPNYVLQPRSDILYILIKKRVNSYEIIKLTLYLFI